MNPKVSIIVPVYNASEFLRRCVDSILTQEYEDFELILADDGSKDDSGAICDAYAAADPRVKVIHKENSGVSDTRNRAMDQAKGTYLQFVDSDDWLTSDATKLMVQTAEEHQCDLVISDFYRVVGERVSPKGDMEDGLLTRTEFAAHMMQNPADYYYGVLWNKLYRRDLIEQHHLRMDAEVSWCEDFLFNLEYIGYASRFYALHAPIYYYVKTKGSLVSQGAGITRTIKMKFMVFEYYNDFYKQVLDEKEYEKMRPQVYRFFLDAAKDGMVLPGSQKLGDERAGISRRAIEGEGILMEAYRDRKLLDHSLEVAAMKNGITLEEARLLLCAHALGNGADKKELADLAGMTPSSMAAKLRKLASRELIQLGESKAQKTEKEDVKKKDKTKDIAEDIAKVAAKDIAEGIAKDIANDMVKDKTKAKAKGTLQISFLPAADALLHDLNEAQEDYERSKFAGFSEEELIQYTCLSEKIKKNTQKILG